MNKQKYKKFTFKELQNWFGNRGILIIPDCIKQCIKDDRFIYWIPNNEKCEEIDCNEITSDKDNRDQIVYCSYRYKENGSWKTSNIVEPQDIFDLEGTLEQSINKYKKEGKWFQHLQETLEQ